jgi:histidine triad (HIT) family protein
LPDGNCLFCRIASGDEDAHVVFEDDLSIAFLDVRPLFAGHTLLIPRRHHETLWDLPAEDVEHYFATVSRLSRGIADVMDARGAFVAINNVVSQSVPHLHTHLVPRNPKDGLKGFFWPRRKYEEGEAEAVVAKLRPVLAADPA